MTEEEKIIQIYESGDVELAYQLMDAIGLEVLNIEFEADVTYNDVEYRISTLNNLRHGKDEGLFIVLYNGVNQYSSQNEYDFNDCQSYEVTFHNDDKSFVDPKGILYKIGLYDLKHKYMINDGNNCLGYVSKKDVLRIIFAK